MARRKVISIIDSLIAHAMTAPVNEVKQLLQTATTVLETRVAQGVAAPPAPATPAADNQPAKPRERTPRVRKPRQAALPDTGAEANTAAPAAPTTPRRGRGRPPGSTSRPPVPAEVPAEEIAQPVVAGKPLPDMAAGDDGEPLGE